MSQPVDAKVYYGYLFEPNKQPTRVLDALLRSIANYIIESLGSKEEKCLTPAKLASFYKAVGGNYDSLFVDVPHPSISWIYVSIGCQHTLQPTNDEFAPPSIPALTTKGFVRWQSIEILLGPEEHVPFIQYAVRNWALTNPDTGELFPVELPKEAFPQKPDADIERWHNSCAEKLRQRATPDEDDGPRPDLPPRPKVQAGFAHIRVPSHHTSRPRPEVSDYFDPKPRSSRPIPYAHVSSTSTSRPVRPPLSHSPAHRSTQFLAPEAESPRLSRSRRRSFPENLNSSPITSPNGGTSPADLRSPPVDERNRRHSHPRHARRGSVSSDASSEGEDSPIAPRRRYTHSPLEEERKPSIRFEVPSPVASPIQPIPTPPDPRARGPGFPIPIDHNGKLSAPFLLGRRDNEARVRGRGGGNAGNVRWKDLSDVTEMWRRRGSKSSEEERVPVNAGRRSSREEREDSGSGGSKRREKERERGDGRPRPVRHSSHDDGMRRDRERDWDRERDREGMGRVAEGGRGPRDRERERRGGSPVRGVDGRYYPPVR